MYEIINIKNKYKYKTQLYGFEHIAHTFPPNKHIIITFKASE
jgi:hypothetical protein